MSPGISCWDMHSVRRGSPAGHRPWGARAWLPLRLPRRSGGDGELEWCRPPCAHPGVSRASWRLRGPSGHPGRCSRLPWGRRFDGERARHAGKLRQGLRGRFAGHWHLESPGAGKKEELCLPARCLPRWPWPVLENVQDACFSFFPSPG